MIIRFVLRLIASTSAIGAIASITFSAALIAASVPGLYGVSAIALGIGSLSFVLASAQAVKPKREGSEA